MFSILFALCADVLLQELGGLLDGDKIVRAFADDSSADVADCRAAVPMLGHLFVEFERLSALALNICKTIFIPLWPVVDFTGLRAFIR